MKNRKKNTKLVLLLLLVCITLGYAALRTGLNINGTTNVTASSWNVHFENYQMSNATNITPTTEPSISGTTTTSISYEVDLDEPGDLYEFSVEVVNGGSLDANISLVSKYNGSEIGPTNPVPSYITYSVTDANGQAITTHRLNHGNRETVKVLVKYRDDDASVLPGEDVEGLSFDVEINAVQVEKVVPTTSTVYIIDSSEEFIYFGYPLPNDLTRYQTEEAALASASYPFFAKYTTKNMDIWKICFGSSENNCSAPYFSSTSCDEALQSYGSPYSCRSYPSQDIVQDAYVGFVITEGLKEEWKEHCGDANDENNAEFYAQCTTSVDNLVSGIYYLRGGIDESEAANQPKYVRNKNIVKVAFNYAEQPEICYEENERFECQIVGSPEVAGYIVSVASNGNVAAYSYNWSNGGCSNTGC